MRRGGCGRVNIRSWDSVAGAGKAGQTSDIWAEEDRWAGGTGTDKRAEGGDEILP